MGRGLWNNRRANETTRVRRNGVCLGTAAIIGLCGLASAQQTSDSPLADRPNGPRSAVPSRHAVTGATVHVGNGTVIENAIVLFDDGKILDVVDGSRARIDLRGTRVWDGTDMHIYPGLIEPWLEVDAPQPDANAPGAHWNTRVTPHRSALDGTGASSADASALRKMGFVAAAIAPTGGNFAGTGAVVSLRAGVSDDSQDKAPVYVSDAFQVVSIDSVGFGGGAGGERYPSSQVGAIALVRQTLLDADWREDIVRSHARTTGSSRGLDPNCLDALARSRNVPMFFESNDELSALREGRLAKEFDRQAVVIGTGDEYKRLDSIREQGYPYIVPLRFPEEPDVSSVAKAENVDLGTLMSWEQAPSNARRLDAAGIRVALTSSRSSAGGRGGSGGGNRSGFMKNVRTAIKHGLSEDRALAMMTIEPAQLLGVAGKLGTVEGGKIASFIVADGELFKEKTKIMDVWIDGVRHEVTAPKDDDIDGDWDATLAGVFRLEIGIKDGKTVTIVEHPEHNEEGDKPKDIEVKAEKVTREGDHISFVFDHSKFGMDGYFTMQGVVQGDAIRGSGLRPDGRAFQWIATKMPKRVELDGVWKLAVVDAFHMFVAIKGDKVEGIEGDAYGDAKDVVINRDGSCSFTIIDEDDGTGEYKVSATYDPDTKTLSGTGTDPSGTVFTWTGTREPTVKLDGDWTATLAGKETTLRIKGQNISFPDNDARTVSDAKIWSNGSLRYLSKEGETESKSSAEFRDGMLVGSGSGVGDDTTFDWTATPRDPEKVVVTAPGEKPEDKVEPVDVPEDLGGYPFGPYSVASLPEQKNVLISGAMVWTCAGSSVIQDGAVLVTDGKIRYVGPSATVPEIANVTVIDARGKHITPGLIDAHSHTGTWSSGTNEGGQAITAEVRMADGTDPDAINWYRQLAGGTTTVNTLHGSANAIGGQNVVQKVRWGVPDPQMTHFVNAKPGIKFALGENPRAVNWGPEMTWRYPQTRMGVESIIRDRFTAARDYAAEWDRYRKSPNTFDHPPRVDLELEAIAEILRGDRLVHSHSYRQDEIFMLCKVAQEFGFRIGTFQHVLEGYKVAEAIRENAIGASSFSDWWGYKIEVQDSIAYNGAIMHEQGVVVSFNSDDDELCRRMNTEATKAIKYGGVDPIEALKFVTINPAKQLMIDDRVGSLEVGKDADIVVWSGNPLSTRTRCERVLIDGREYFSLEQDAAHRDRIRRERERLVQKILAGEKKKDADTDEAAGPRPSGPPGRGQGRRRPPEDDRGFARFFDSQEHADSMREMYLERIRRGMSIEDAVRGECGCGLDAMFQSMMMHGGDQ